MENEKMNDSSQLQPSHRGYPVDQKDMILALGAILCALFMVNVVFFGGFHLGFAVVSLALIGLAAIYLRVAGRRCGVYSTVLLILSGVIAAGYARSDDGFVKFVLLGFLFVGVSQALGIQSGQNRKLPGRFSTLLDSFRTVFGYGFGRWSYAISGLVKGIQSSGTVGKKTGGVVLGLLIAVPVLAVVVALLISADAAFAGLIEQLPEFRFGEAVVTVLFGSFLAMILVSYLLTMRHRAAVAATQPQRKGFGGLTINTVLAALSLVYVVYLLSQLAYFVGGFSGILPEGYTMAEYARRGFFEMAVLCGINLAVMAVSMALVAKNPKAPLMTRLLCLFIGLVTLFFVASASAKMALYIQSYGLTRLRLLTEVIMLFLGVSTIVVCIWVFEPRLPYMKAVIVTALLFGALVIWGDVDTVVAHYNVTAYQQGVLKTVDVPYLQELNASSIPYLQALTEDSDPIVAQQAAYAVALEKERNPSFWEDFRDWNLADWMAEKLLQEDK